MAAPRKLLTWVPRLEAGPEHFGGLRSHPRPQVPANCRRPCSPGSASCERLVLSARWPSPVSVLSPVGSVSALLPVCVSVSLSPSPSRFPCILEQEGITRPRLALCYHRPTTCLRHSPNARVPVFLSLKPGFLVSLLRGLNTFHTYSALLSTAASMTAVTVCLLELLFTD